MTNLLKVFSGHPFPGSMKVGNSPSLDSLRWEVAVTKLAQNTVRQQGQAAVELIQAASAPQAADNGSVGSRLHVVA